MHNKQIVQAASGPSFTVLQNTTAFKQNRLKRDGLLIGEAREDYG